MKALPVDQHILKKVSRTVNEANRQQAVKQYTLAQVIGIWLLAAAPMGLLAWVVFPALKDRVSMHPGIFLWVLMIVGMMWQVVLGLT